MIDDHAADASATPTPNATNPATNTPADTAAATNTPEHRKQQRSEHIQPVRIVVFDQEGHLVDQGWGEVLDLSPSGLRLRGLALVRKTEVTPAHRLKLDIVFDDGSLYLEVRSAPRWNTTQGEWGLEFDNVDVRVA